MESNTELKSEKSLSVTERLHESLQDLIGLHKQLLEVVRAENVALVNADTKGTFEAVTAKEALIHWIHQAEMSRQAITYALCSSENLDQSRPSLRELILHFQSKDPILSQKLQTDLTTLIVIVDRIKKQNEANGSLVGSSLNHIQNMKNNIFGETTHQARTYNQLGQKNQGSVAEHGPRLVSKEV